MQTDSCLPLLMKIIEIEWSKRQFEYWNTKATPKTLYRILLYSVFGILKESG